MYKQRLDEIRADHAKNIKKEMKKLEDELTDKQENRDFEKLRCEKQMFEQKYTAYKDRYYKLKNDMRAAVEKRNRRKELAKAAAAAAEATIVSSTSPTTIVEPSEASDKQQLVHFISSFKFIHKAFNF